MAASSTAVAGLSTPWEAAAPTSFQSAGPDIAIAPWLQPYEASGWARTLPALGAAGFPALLGLAGCAVGVAVPLVLHFRHPEGRTFRGVGPAGQVLAAGGLTLILVLAVALIGLHSSGLSAASGGLQGARGDADRLGQLGAGLNASASVVMAELGRLTQVCPQQVQSILGGSIQETRDKVTTLVTNVGLYSGIVAPLPDQLDQVDARNGGAGMALGAYLVLSTVAAAGAAAAVVAAAVDVQFGSSALQHRLGHLTQFELPALGVLGGLATALVALSAAAELSLGARAGAFCGDTDATALRYVGEEFGWNSSSYGLSRFYIAGRGSNPALTTLTDAQSAVDASKDWVNQYQWVIQKSCPQWSPANITSALEAAMVNINSSKALLAPAIVYTYYQSAARDSICEGAVPTLGWLVFLQAALALFCLPALVLVGSIFLRTVTEGRQFSRLHQEEHDSDEEKDKDFNPLYYVVYAFSVFTFIIGALMYFLPSDSIGRRIVGTLLYASGIFLMTNSDLIVTYFRMHYQMDRMKKNNEHFEKSLTEQANIVRDLSKAKQGLDTIGKRFGGDVKKAMKEVDRLSDIVKSDLKMACKSLLRLYLDKDANRLISEGEEVDQATQLMELVFGGVFRKDYGLRAGEMRGALVAHPRFKKDRGISEATFVELQSNALVEIDTRKIAETSKRIMDSVKGK